MSACLWFLFVAVPATAQTCAHLAQPRKFRRTEYRVREVRIESKLDFLHAISSYLKETRAQLPLQPGRVLRLSQLLSDLSKGKNIIEDKLNEAEQGADPRTRIRVVLGRIENCQETSTPAEVDAVYRIFLTNYDAYFSHTLELKTKEVERPADAAAEPKAKGFLTIKPLVGYNRTRRLFGGGLLRLRAPGGIFDSAELNNSGSTTSNAEDFALTGTRRPNLAILDHLEYRLTYKHSDLPTEANRLREGVLLFQAFGASRPRGKKGLVLRYGTSLEGGNQQSDLVTAAAAADSTAASGYGTLKAYVGTTLRTHRYSLAGSYAIQLGARGATTDVDFIKHLADLSLTTQLFKDPGKPGEVHKALTVETRLAGGIIQHPGRVPVAQRFFGGNVQKDFIAGDSWRILSGPFIRSIPENRLSTNAAGGDIGGTSFYSVNLTVAREVWGRPILPKEIAADPEFRGALRASERSARNILRNTYLSKVPGYVAFAARVAALEPELTSLRGKLEGLLTTLPAELSQDQKDEIEEARDLARDEIVKIDSTFEDQEALPGKLSDLLKEADGNACAADDSCSRITTLRNELNDLAELLNEAGANATEISGAEASLKQQQATLVHDLDTIDVSRADQLADADMNVLTPVLDSFVNDLNWVAVSPVAVFDVARVWPDRAGTRFGVGGGVRLSLVNFNVTLGYALNPRRRERDGRGALFFSMDFTDIFR